MRSALSIDKNCLIRNKNKNNHYQIAILIIGLMD